jgi:hypothetical protein
MKYEKLNSEIVRFIKVGPELFDSLDESVQRALVETAEEMRKKEEKIRELEEKEKIHEQEKAFMKFQLQVDDYQSRLEELGHTQSEDYIRHSVEYFELRQKVVERLYSSEISPEEGRMMLDEFVADVVRKNAAARKREYRAKVKERVEVEEKDRVMRFRVVGTLVREMRMSEFERVEEIASDQGLSLVIPLKDDIIGIVENMKLVLISNYSKVKNPYFIPQLSVRFSGGGRYVSNTALVIVGGELLQDWYDLFKQKVTTKFYVYVDPEKYEDPIEDLSMVVKFSVIMRQLKTIESWFASGKDIGPVIKYADFELFTANNKQVNCVQQCVEYFGKLYDPELGDDFITQLTQGQENPMRVKVYTPKVDVNNMKWFNQLMEVKDTHPEELDITDDCKNIARILEYQGHVGIITKIKEKHNIFQLRQTRVRKDSEGDYSEVSADIETFISLNNGKVLPYLLCWQDFNKTKMNYTYGEKCIEEFIDQIINNHEKVIIYCWNGAAFDFQLMIGKMKKISSDDKFFVRNNKVIYGRVKINGCEIILKDPCLFIPSSLASAAKDFGVISKSSFPHDIITKYEDLEKVVQNWYIIRQEVSYTNDTENPKVKLFKTINYKQFIATDNGKTVLQKAIEYCSIDVYCCMDIWKKFTKIIKGLFDL